MQPFAMHDKPLFKGGAVQRESRKKVSTVQLSGFPQPIRTGPTNLETAVPMLVAGGDQAAKFDRIHPIVALWVDANGLAGREQEGTSGLSIADGGPQAAQRLAQVLVRCRVGLVRPQQASQHVPAAGCIGVRRQVGQQRARRVCPKAGHWIAV
jgi:hypothetical protein